MVLFPHSAVSTLIFPAALKTFTTFCCSPHLSLKPPPPPPTVKHDRPEPPPHHSSFLLRCLQDESLSLQTNLCESFLHTEPELASLLLVGLFAAFSDLFIHWWLLHLTPVKKFIPSFACALCGLQIWFEICIGAWIYLLWRSPLYILESLISRGGLTLEWGGVIFESAQHATSK